LTIGNAVDVSQEPQLRYCWEGYCLGFVKPPRAIGTEDICISSSHLELEVDDSSEEEAAICS